jgi:hypothetical protein
MLRTESAQTRSNANLLDRSYQRSPIARLFLQLRSALQSPVLFISATVLLALAIRLIIVAIVFRDVAAPTLDHNEFGWEMGWTARSIALHQGFSSPFLPRTGPTAIVPPIYPYLLAGIFRLFGLYSAASAAVILSINSLISALTCIPIYFSLRHAVSTRIARFATLGWAIYPFAIYFSADRVWDYALTAFLFTTCFWAAQRLHLRGPWAWFTTGILFGVTVLSNPSVLSVLPFLILFSLYKVRRVDGPWLRNGLIVLLTCAAIWTPWGLRNHRVLHTNSTFRDGFWLEFYAGNNGDTSDSNPASAHPASNPLEMQKYQSLGEINYIAQKRILAIDFVQQHPAFFAAVTVRRVIRFWTGFWSFSREYLHREPLDVPNVFFCTALTLFLLRGIRRWWRDDPASSLPYLVALFFFPIPYYFTHSSMDYRQPIEPMILSLVVIGIFGLREKSANTDIEHDPFLHDLIAEETEDEPVAVAAMGLAPSV